MSGTTDLPTGLPSLLGGIYLGARTGRLRLAREGERIRLAFQRGRLVRAESIPERKPAPPAEGPEDELARHLLRILRELHIGRFASDGDQAGNALGRDALLAALAWSGAQATFEEEDVLDVKDGVATTEELVLAAVRRLPDDPAVRAALGEISRPLGLAVSADFDRELSQTEAYILSRVDGRLSAAEVLQLVPSSSGDPERSLLGLLLTGVVELLEPTRKTLVARAEAIEEPVPVVPAPAPLPASEPPNRNDPRRREVLEAYENLVHQSHFETLGVSPGASELEIKQAFFSKARKFHPDQYRDPALADIADRIEALFMRIGGAYEVLRDPQSRQSYEAVLRRRRGSEPPRPAPASSAPAPTAAPDDSGRYQPDALIDTAENAWMAEEAIHRAERLIADTKVWDAIQLLQAVIPRIFGRKQRERARVLLAKAYIKNPNWLRRGEELLQTVIQEDPQNAEAHYALGMLYKESGMSSRSVAMFRKTVELKPEHKNALAELNALSGPAFLRKLFGKG